MHFSLRRRVVSCLAVALAGTPAVLALEPTTPLARLGRQSWTMETGLPQNTVPVLLQSRSGYFWAGTELGLARFDGAGFRILDHATAPAFPDAEIRCLLDGSDGVLWVGTSDGLVQWSNNHAALFNTRDGLPANSIRGLAQTSDGALWIWTDGGLARLRPVNGHPYFAAIPADANAPRGVITSIAADSASLWVATSLGVSRFSAGQWTAIPESQSHTGPSLVQSVAAGVLVSVPDGIFLESKDRSTLAIGKANLPSDGVSFLAQFAGGAIAAASKSSLVLAHGASPVHLSASAQLGATRIESVYADREGSLWVGANRGLARITLSASGLPSVQLLPATDPLSASSVVSLLEDREGDMWAGTETTGLHILRDARFRVVGAGEGLSSDNTTAVVEDANHTLWIGTRDAGLNRVSATQTTTLTAAQGLLSDVILSLAVGPDNVLWVGTPDGLNRIQSGVTTALTTADGLPDDFIRSLLVAPDGSLWVGTRRGLTHLDHGRPRTFSQSDGLGSDLVGSVVRTPDGDLWIATLNGLTRMHQGRLHNYTTADGLSSNVITALDVTPDGLLWIGTQSSGINLWDGARFQSIHDQPGRLPSALHALIHDDAGHLWMASDFGLARADLDALKACALHGACSFATAYYTTADGLLSRDTASNSHPTACKTHSGQLWFSTPRGVVVTDPAHFSANLSAPPVVIEHFAVDDRDQDQAQLSDTYSALPIRIKAGHLRFQFDYSGLSFAAPQKLRYQYLLENFDHEWTDAGTRRTAYYTNIPPGHYRFRVRAFLSDTHGQNPASGAADTASSEADLSFELLPHFYQTAWFLTLVAVAGAALVLLIFRRRVLRVEREFRAVMAERNRIAREIHDTLAQGYVGISVQLEVLGELLRHNRPDAAARHLEIAKTQVREGLDDARQSIWALRSQDANEQTLPVRLRRLVEKSSTRTLVAALEVHGAYRSLPPDTEQEILRIAQETIHNTIKHAAASRVTVRLEYDDRAVALTVADDGRGFNPAVQPEGHYGLTGMRERAALIRGQIAITSQPGKGVTVRLEVPALASRDSNISPGAASSSEQDSSREDPVATGHDHH